jgi:hypothetical protein
MFGASDCCSESARNRGTEQRRLRVGMLRKRKEPNRKNVAEILMRDIQGTAAEKRL